MAAYYRRLPAAANATAASRPESSLCRPAIVYRVHKRFLEAAWTAWMAVEQCRVQDKVDQRPVHAGRSAECLRRLC